MFIAVLANTSCVHKVCFLALPSSAKLLIPESSNASHQYLRVWRHLCNLPIHDSGSASSRVFIQHWNIKWDLKRIATDIRGVPVIIEQFCFRKTPPLIFWSLITCSSFQASATVGLPSHCITSSSLFQESLCSWLLSKEVSPPTSTPPTKLRVVIDTACFSLVSNGHTLSF